jgi:hypothetical protein
MTVIFISILDRDLPGEFYFPIDLNVDETGILEQ